MKALDNINISKVENSCNLYYKKNGDAGYDLYSTKDKWIFPFKVYKIPLNIKLELKENTFGLITSRSGKSLKGLFVIPGIIDSNYRGQVNAIVTKIGLLPHRIKKNTRIAQMIILEYKDYHFAETNNLNKSNRNEKGFGSSGDR